MHSDVLLCQALLLVLRAPGLSYLESIQARNGLSACRLPDGQVDAIMVMYDEFWAAQNKAESAAASRPRAHIPKAATAANPSAAPADSSRAKGQSRRAKAKEAAADSGSGSAEAETLSQHGADRAADVAGGATGKKLAKPGRLPLCLYLHIIMSCIHSSMQNLATSSHIHTVLRGGILAACC